MKDALWMLIEHHFQLLHKKTHLHFQLTKKGMQSQNLFFESLPKLTLTRFPRLPAISGFFPTPDSVPTVPDLACSFCSTYMNLAAV